MGDLYGPTKTNTHTHGAHALGESVFALSKRISGVCRPYLWAIGGVQPDATLRSRFHLWKLKEAGSARLNLFINLEKMQDSGKYSPPKRSKPSLLWGFHDNKKDSKTGSLLHKSSIRKVR